jgi:hypothetical protein
VKVFAGTLWVTTEQACTVVVQVSGFGGVYGVVAAAALSGAARASRTAAELPATMRVR